jgi:26S proteasome regulatory subunit N2
LADTTPSEPKTLVNLKGKKPVQPTTLPTTLHDQVAATIASQPQDVNVEEPTNEAEGAAEAAGVLTAVDEDVEGGEEAELPHEFDYHSDAYDEEG